MIEKVITLDSVEPVEIYGVNDVKLNVIKKYFPKLKIVARGYSIKVLGDEAEIAHFEKKLMMMVDYYHKNGILTVPVLTAAPIITVVNNCGSSILSTTATGTILWSNGATISSITVTVAGNYTVTRTVNGCTSAIGNGIAAPKVLPLAPTASVTQPTCTVATGTITITSSKTVFVFGVY